jgi:hypothetical protein
MARDFARVRGRIWSDDDWRALPGEAQWLYLHLLSAATLNYAGVADWRPSRIAALTGNWTATDIEEFALHLEHARYVVIDRDTEEALIRSFLRHDGLMGQPNVAAAMVKDFAGIASTPLRGVFIHELQRLHEDEPDLRGWSRKDVTALLRRDPLTPDEALPLLPSNPSGNPSPNPSGNPSPNPSGNPSTKGSDSPSAWGSVDPSLDPSVNPCPTTTPAPTPSPSSIRRGELTYSGAQADAETDEPPLRCSRHKNHDDPPNCGKCKEARIRHEAWEVEARRPRPLPPKCDECSEQRWIEDEDGNPLRKCPTCHPQTIARRTA